MAKNEIPKLLERIKAVSYTVAFTAPARSSEKVIDSMQKVGPRWTGRFSNSWIIQNEQLGLLADGTQQPGDPSPIKFAISPSRTAIKRALKSGKSIFSITNMTPYANQAADLEDFVAEPVGFEPDNVKRGERENKRGLVSVFDEGPDRATAELDWFSDYAQSGGTMQSEVENTFRRIFERVK